MSQEIQERLLKVQEELRQIQAELSETEYPRLAVDMAVSAVNMAWHANRNEYGLAKHNLTDLLAVADYINIHRR
jgi:hypothetical protein